MAELLTLPRMTDTMEEGFIAEVVIKVGDKVSSGDVVAEVETDKATMPFESFQEGTVLHLEVKSGDSIPVGGVIAVLGEKGEDFKALLEEAKNAAPAEAKEEAAAPAAEPAPAAPTPAPQPAVIPAAAPIAAPAAVATPSANGDGRVKASPLAKSIAKEAGVDISAIPGSGDEGRIVKKDVEAYLANPKAFPTAVNPEIIGTVPAVVGQESFDEKPLSQMRKTIAKRLAESKYSAPHFYLTMEINMNQAIAARKKMNEVSPVKISFNDLVIKACGMALKKHPAVNSSWLGDRIRTNHHVHIGMAVAVEDGLVVPVIKFADEQPLSSIAAQSKNFAAKARDKKIMPDDMQGNTFSISNLGMFGIDEFTAIINPPDACILAVGSIKETLALKDGEVVVNNIMKVTLSCDHRVVDGATGSLFLNTMKGFLEEPVSMLV